MPVSEEEFRRRVEPHRAELHAHCYRMLGSVDDADDALQDALLRAWRGLGRFEDRSSLRTWLYRIATNAALDLIGHRPQRVLPLDHSPAADPADGFPEPIVERIWIEPYPDAELGYEQRESVELAFVAAVQRLPGTQRAVLLLRDVLGFKAREVAETLDTSVQAVNSALARARRALDEQLPERSQQETLRTLGDRAVRDLVARYMAALDRGDVPAIVGLLAQDATWSMPPLAAWYRGHEAIVGFLGLGPTRVRWRHLPAHANGQPAAACYLWDGERFVAEVLDVLTLDGDRITAVTAFIDRDCFARFGLPDVLE